MESIAMEWITENARVEKTTISISTRLILRNVHILFRFLFLRLIHSFKRFPQFAWRLCKPCFENCENTACTKSQQPGVVVPVKVHFSNKDSRYAGIKNTKNYS